MPIPFDGQVRPARAVYDELASRERQVFLDEARDVSAVTIPHLVPPEGYNSSTQQRLKTTYQSIGARGVNNLASKLLLSLYPPNTSFFKLVVLEESLAKAGATPKVKGEVEESLVAMEQRVQRELELHTFRPRAFEAFRHLIVAGNAVLYTPNGASWKVYHLDQFVVRRDAFDDRVLLLIVKESISRDEARGRVADERLLRAPAEGSATGCDYLNLYTAVYWDDDAGRYVEVREIGDAPVIDEDGERDEKTYRPDELPWLPLRLTTDEDNYGRGVGADLLGDLVTVDALWQAMAEGAAIATRMVGLVEPGSGLTPQDLNRAPNGTWLLGYPTRVGTVTTEKARDLTFAFNALQTIERRLSESFLLHSAATRQAERVTAEEIRFVAQELEDVLGGVYSSLSQEFQLPLARQMIATLTRRKVLPKLPPGLVAPTVVTGLEALGRGQEFSRIRLYLQSSTETLGPQMVAQYINPREVLSRLATSLSIDTLNLIRSEDEVQQAQRLAQAQAAVSTLGPAAIQAAGRNPNALAAARGQLQQQQQQ